MDPRPSLCRDLRFLGTRATLTTDIITFLVAGGVALVAGIRLSKIADEIADRTGLGEAMVGAVLLGATTSLPGITASITAGWDGHPNLALSNAYGGIMAQTAFLVVADVFYRKANLEHAAASIPNLQYGSLLMALLSVTMISIAVPNLAIGWVHVGTPVMFGFYVFGLKLTREAKTTPMWRPRKTRDTKEDEPQERSDKSNARLWGEFLFEAAAMIAAGWFLTRASERLAAQTGVDEAIVGAFLLAVVTSLPELVTSVAAVRQGALTLAVGGILGGNAFDTLFAACADLAYTEGPIYGAARQDEQILVSVSLLMTAVLIMGLLHRERHGIANIGFESFTVLVLYAAGVAMIFLN